MDQKLLPFYWRGGFRLLVELQRCGGSAINGATPSSLECDAHVPRNEGRSLIIIHSQISIGSMECILLMSISDSILLRHIKHWTKLKPSHCCNFVRCILFQASQFRRKTSHISRFLSSRAEGIFRHTKVGNQLVKGIEPQTKSINKGKFCIGETINILRCADSSTGTKTNRFIFF